MIKHNSFSNVFGNHLTNYPSLLPFFSQINGRMTKQKFPNTLIRHRNKKNDDSIASKQNSEEESETFSQTILIISGL